MSCNKSWKCYFGCEVDGVLHRFPNPRQNAERFHLWTIVFYSDIQNRDPMYIYNTLRLCDKHFELCYRTPNGKLTRNAFPTMNTAAYQSGSQPLLMDEAVLRESSNIDLTSTSAAYQSGSQPLLMDESVLGESSNIHLTSASDTQEITQPTKLQSDLLINLISGQNPFTSQALDANVTLHVQNNVENPSTSKDILQSADTCVVTKRQLLRNTYKLKDKLKRLSAKCKTQKQQFKIASNLAKSKVFLKYIESLPEPVQSFTEMQMKIKKKPRGRRYSIDEKILVLSILKQSPKAYNMLKKMFVLPSKRCLQQQLSLIRLEPGVNAQVFTHLKRAVKKLPKEKRLCTLIFDEVSIEPGLHFNSKNITGFEDYGHKTSNQIADHALVFMIKSIKGKFKQPICFTFCKSCTKKYDLKYLIILMIKEIHKTGLKVVATICDQSQTNMSVIKSLKEDTRIEYLQKGLDHISYSFEIEEAKIFPLFDTPHLLKGVRNHLLKKDATFVENGQEHFAKWEHIVMLYNIDVGDQEIRLVNKLTECHIYENKIPKMKVKYAAQVFSQRVSSAIGFLARHNILPRECQGTARMLLLFDQLFDTFNGHTYSDTAKRLTGCLKASSAHISFWKGCLPILKSIKFRSVTKGKDGTEKIKFEKVPSISNWILNIETWLEMWEILKKEHSITSILTRNFNQDPIENFFCGIRSNGVRNTNPTCGQFVNAYKTLLLNNLSSPHSVNANCEADDNKCLQSLKNLLKPQRDNDLPETPITFNVNRFLETLSANLKCGEENVNIIHKESKRYVAGYIIKQCQTKIFKNCEICKTTLINNNIDPATYIYFRDYTKKSLLYASEEFIDLTKKIYDIIILCLRDSPHDKNLKEKIMFYINLDINFNIICCQVHRSLLIKFIINLATNVVVHSWCKGVNLLLKGKLSNFDQSDLVKSQAREYYLKRWKKIKQK